MTQSEHHLQRPPSPPPGRIARTLQRWFMRPARIAAIETFSPRFRLIDLEGEALRNAGWTIGQKIQVSIGPRMNARTYTPMSWDEERGSTRLLVFAHGDGPGSRWANDLTEGDTCQFFGPRRSLDLSVLDNPAVLFGDETSFALAAALHASPQGSDVIYRFEASDITEARLVLEAVGLGKAMVIERRPEEVHFDELETELSRVAVDGGHFILTGKASSIQRMSRTLKSNGVGSSRLKAKAYWAAGKVGLD